MATKQSKTILVIGNSVHRYATQFFCEFTNSEFRRANMTDLDARHERELLVTQDNSGYLSDRSLWFRNCFLLPFRIAKRLRRLVVVQTRIYRAWFDRETDRININTADRIPWDVISRSIRTRRISIRQGDVARRRVNLSQSTESNVEPSHRRCSGTSAILSPIA